MKMIRLRNSVPRTTIFYGMILTMVLPSAASAQNKASDVPPPTIVFVCEHGAAKSVIAAAYFNKIAAERRLNFHAVARGVTPQPDLSAAAVAGLHKDGVPFQNEKPRGLDRDVMRAASRVVAFDPVPASLAEGRSMQSFDVPAPKDGYVASRDAILTHVRALIDELASDHKKTGAQEN